MIFFDMTLSMQNKSRSFEDFIFMRESVTNLLSQSMFVH
jgi:hypothetical protein